MLNFDQPVLMGIWSPFKVLPFNKKCRHGNKIIPYSPFFYVGEEYFTITIQLFLAD